MRASYCRHRHVPPQERPGRPRQARARRWNIRKPRGRNAVAPRAPMAYFGNRTVNLLNLHYAIHSLALSGGGTFFAVFLLKAGVPAPGVLASVAAILLGRFMIRPIVLV